MNICKKEFGNFLSVCYSRIAIHVLIIIAKESEPISLMYYVLFLKKLAVFQIAF